MSRTALWTLGFGLSGLVALACGSAGGQAGGHASDRSSGATARCPLDGTFVQFRGDQIGWGRPEWSHALDELHALGLSTIVLQHTGDPYGSYESYDRHPLTSLLEEADARGGFSVWLGLAHAPGWPGTVPDRMPPLADPRAVEQLGRLCETHASCAGFYLSPEIEDTNWASRLPQLHAFLGDAVSVLRGRVPRARFAIAPYFTRALEPGAYADFIADAIAGLGIDVVMLQGGTGTGRVTADDVRRYLVPLIARLRASGTETWLVVELFAQRSGPPIDDSAFSAGPAEPDAVRAALLSDLDVRRIGYTVSDYLHPRLRASWRRGCTR
jgi:hypothetical protein